MTIVLVVDDNRELRHLLKLLLQREGHGVVLAEDGEEGLDAVVAHHPAVVLCDYAMPRLDGPGFCRKLRSYPDCTIARTPVIGFSASTSGDVEKEFLAAGANVVLPKPSRLTIIAATIARFTNGG